jgi:hypothetical protein
MDVTALRPKQLKAVVSIFDELKDEKLLPLHELDKDPVRQKLDERFALEVLGLPASVVEPGGPLELLRMKLAQEPSVHGGKVTDGEDEGE